ncbi:vasoactive intestinal polypeptide receptor 2 isoform X3 [Manis javanica]|uniref:vasoactive intestinal polypeptide receptor 2 isoform X3 n=1 Tax=Manis javanica TaxID=9974 RepID=UPI003C6D5DB8
MRAPALLPFGLLTCCGWLLAPVNSIHPECRFHLEIQEEETRCAELLGPQTENYKASAQLLETCKLESSKGSGTAQHLTVSPRTSSRDSGRSHGGRSSRRQSSPPAGTAAEGCPTASSVETGRLEHGHCPRCTRNLAWSGQYLYAAWSKPHLKHKPCTCSCPGVWDNITCWPPADVGETVTVPCPKVFSNFYSKPGNISKNCTSDGWSEMFPDFIDACGFHDPEDESKIMFYVLVKATYTLGYSVSLISLTTGSIILCLFRRLHCTRNHIHLNLFLSFILRAVSVLVKDDVLYSSSGRQHCPDQQSSWVGCKLSLVLFQYCVMSNFYWLLAEGLHLHALLVAMFPSRCFTAYLLIGWGVPTICTGAWAATRLSLEDTGCWDTNDHSIPWWVIRTPILISIIVNFVLFVSIIRILLQKLTSPGVGGNDQSQYKPWGSCPHLMPALSLVVIQFVFVNW